MLLLNYYYYFITVHSHVICTFVNVLNDELNMLLFEVVLPSHTLTKLLRFSVAGLCSKI